MLGVLGQTKVTEYKVRHTWTFTWRSVPGPLINIHSHVDHLFLHSFSTALSGLRSRGQQSERRCPNLPVHTHLLQTTSRQQVLQMYQVNKISLYFLCNLIRFSTLAYSDQLVYFIFWLKHLQQAYSTFSTGILLARTPSKKKKKKKTTTTRTTTITTISTAANIALPITIIKHS